MPYRYSCPRCGITSAQYSLRSGAERHGVEHRNKRHDGDHPDGEYIQQERYALPEGNDRWIMLALLAFLALSTISKYAF